MVKFIMYILPQLFFLKKQAWYHPTPEILMQAMSGVGWAWGFVGLQVILMQPGCDLCPRQLQQPCPPAPCPLMRA